VLRNSPKHGLVVSPTLHSEREKQSFSGLDSAQFNVVVEALSYKIQGLEKENIVLKQVQKELETKNKNMEKRIEAQSTTLNAHMLECYEKIPTRDDYPNKIDPFDSEFLYSMQKYSLEEIQILAEKMFLENMRLKKDLLLLGSEINAIVRNSKQ